MPRIECPHCLTSYPTNRCGIPDDLDVVFTVVCLVCKRQIDGAIETIEVPGKPATRLHRWTWGYFGDPALEPASTRIVKIVKVRVE